MNLKYKKLWDIEECDTLNLFPYIKRGYEKNDDFINITMVTCVSDIFSLL